MNSLNTIKSIFLKDDILPLGSFETLPVSHILDGQADSYPNVLHLRSDIDYEGLLEESIEHMKIVGFNYVKPRIKEINQAIPEETLRDVLADVGFFKGSYQSYSIRKIGTGILEDWVLPKTRAFFDSLPIKTFRQQYAVAAPGWNVKLHRDHGDFKLHGFRAMVPLSADVYMGYEESHRKLVYKLERGNMYFVNIAKMHRGFNEHETTDRVNLIMQMDSDEMLFSGKMHKPLTEEQIDMLPQYARNYEVWEFGYEL